MYPTGTIRHLFSFAIQRRKATNPDGCDAVAHARQMSHPLDVSRMPQGAFLVETNTYIHDRGLLCGL